MRRACGVWLLIGTLWLPGCAGTSTGNPAIPTDGTTTPGVGDVTLRFASYTPTASGWGLPFASSVFAGVSNVRFCFAQVAFTASDGTQTTLAFAVGEKTIATVGTELGVARLTPGVYTGIELGLASSCASGKSVRFTSLLGSIETADAITLTFRTNFTVPGGKSFVDLKTKSFIDPLNAVTVPVQIKLVLEAVIGVVDGVVGG